MDIAYFFSWENFPAVIAESGEFAKPFFLPWGDESWTAASGAQMIDFWEDGTKLSEEEFENDCERDFESLG